MIGVSTENAQNKTFLQTVVLPRKDCVEATFVGTLKDVEIDRASRVISMFVGRTNLNIIINLTKFQAEPAEKSYLVSELKKFLVELEPKINLFLLVKPNMINNIYIKDLENLHDVKVYNSEIQLKLDLQDKKVPGSNYSNSRV